MIQDALPWRAGEGAASEESSGKGLVWLIFCPEIQREMGGGHIPATGAFAGPVTTSLLPEAISTKEVFIAR